LIDERAEVLEHRTIDRAVKLDARLAIVYPADRRIDGPKIADPKRCVVTALIQTVPTVQAHPFSDKSVISA